MYLYIYIYTYLYTCECIYVPIALLYTCTCVCVCECMRTYVLCSAIQFCLFKFVCGIVYGSFVNQFRFGALLVRATYALCMQCVVAFYDCHKAL